MLVPFLPKPFARLFCWILSAAIVTVTSKFSFSKQKLNFYLLSDLYMCMTDGYNQGLQFRMIPPVPVR